MELLIEKILRVRCLFILFIVAQLSSCALFQKFEDCQIDQDCTAPLSYCAEDNLCKQYTSAVSLPSQCQLTAGVLKDSLPIGMLLPLSGPFKSFAEGLFLAAELALETIQRDTTIQPLSIIACDSNESSGQELHKLFQDLNIEIVLGPLLPQTILKLQESELNSEVSYLTPSLSSLSFESSDPFISFAAPSNASVDMVNLLGNVIPNTKPEGARKIKVFWIANIDAAYSRSIYENIVSRFDDINELITQGDEEIVHEVFSYTENQPLNAEELNTFIEEDDDFVVSVILNRYEGWPIVMELEGAFNHPNSIYVLSEWSMTPQKAETMRSFDGNGELENRIFGLTNQSVFEQEGQLSPLASLFKSSYKTRFYINPQFIPFSGRIYDLMFFAAWAIEKNNNEQKGIRQAVELISQKLMSTRATNDSSCSSNMAPAFCANPDGLRAIIKEPEDSYLVGAAGPLLLYSENQEKKDSIKGWCLVDKAVELFSLDQMENPCFTENE